MVMGVSDSVTTSFPPPVIHDSHVFSLPCFMLNPIIRFYTINYIPLLYYPFSPFSPPPRLIHRVGRSSDITLRCVLHPHPPLKAPISGAKPTRRAAELLRDQAFEVHSRVRDGDCYAALCPERLTTTQTETLTKIRVFFVSAVLFR